MERKFWDFLKKFIYERGLIKMERICLKNGYIIDGSGEKGFIGDVLIENCRIKQVSQTSLNVDCPIIDCTGLAISPGFIDSHSHQDNYIFADNELAYTKPFIHQGITTYVAGNCGFSAAGVLRGSCSADLGGLSTAEELGISEMPWNTYAEYFDYLRKKGIRQNMATFAGHGTALASVVGLTPKGKTSPEDMKKVSAILEEGMAAGCKGISFGLGYRPGVFVPDTEIREIAELAIKRNKLITVHSRVMGSMAPDLYGEDYSVPHNVRWLKGFLELFRNSGARLQSSHLLFVGRKAWPSYDQMFEMLQDMMDHGGMDLWFDMYSYIQGITNIGIRMPKFFYDHLPEIYDDKSLMPELEAGIKKINSGRGIELNDVLLCDGKDAELNQYRGMYMDEICEARNMTPGELYMDIYKRSNGDATIYIMVEQPEEYVLKQMVHERALYMTDAWIIPGSLQNPCAYGAMPKFLRVARETGNLPVEQVIAHMTGRAAKRFDLFGRGLLKDGYFADIVVFDPKTIADKATPKDPEQYPVGISHVFINGAHVLDHDKLDETLKAGMVL